MKNTAVAHALAEYSQLDADHAFVVPGDDPFFHAAIEDAFVPIVMRDERGAGFAAQVYGRLRGVGFACTSHGPGMANLCTPLAAAFLDRDPLVALCSALPDGQRHTYSHAYVNEHLLEHVTSTNTVATSPRHLPSASSLARMACGEDASPVAIHITRNASKAEAEELLEHDVPSTESATPLTVATLGEVLSALERASAVSVICGAGVRRAKSVFRVASIIRHLNARPLSSLNGAGCTGTRGETIVTRHNLTSILQGSDCLIAIGLDESEGISFDQYGGSVVNIARCKNGVKESVGIFGPLATSLDELDKSIGVNDLATQEKQLLQEPKKWVGSSPVEALADHSESFRGHVVLDTGLFRHAWPGRFSAASDDHLICSNGLSSIGWALGASIGAIVATKKRVLAVVGDGSLSKTSFHNPSSRSFLKQMRAAARLSKA